VAASEYDWSSVSLEKYFGCLGWFWDRDVLVREKTERESKQRLFIPDLILLGKTLTSDAIQNIMHNMVFV